MKNNFNPNDFTALITKAEELMSIMLKQGGVNSIDDCMLAYQLYEKVKDQQNVFLEHFVDYAAKNMKDVEEAQFRRDLHIQIRRYADKRVRNSQCLKTFFLTSAKKHLIDDEHKRKEDEIKILSDRKNGILKAIHKLQNEIAEPDEIYKKKDNLDKIECSILKIREQESDLINNLFLTYNFNPFLEIAKLLTPIDNLCRRKTHRRIDEVSKQRIKTEQLSEKEAMLKVKQLEKKQKIQAKKQTKLTDVVSLKRRDPKKETPSCFGDFFIGTNTASVWERQIKEYCLLTHCPLCPGDIYRLFQTLLKMNLLDNNKRLSYQKFGERLKELNTPEVTVFKGSGKSINARIKSTLKFDKFLGQIELKNAKSGK